MTFYDPPPKKYNICYGCGIAKSWNFDKYCLSCRDAMENDEDLWNEIQAWIDSGCLNFEHVPGPIHDTIST